jgi:competence protein ComEC
MRKSIIHILALLLINQQAFALDIEDDAVFVRVIDTGAGLATITRMPGDYYMVYDAGHWHGKQETMDGIDSVISDNEEIDLLVISHSDADHLSAVPEILNEYEVKKIIRGGLERTSLTNWNNANSAIVVAKNSGETEVINLKHDELHFGSTFIFEEALVTFVSGFYAPPDSWDIEGGKTGGEFRNAGSIVIRLSFKGKSILFTGDAVGRHREDPDDVWIATEKFMIKNSDAINIDSDVLIAPHHGGDNGSSTEFIKKVSPTWVIFSAGHRHKHPTKNAAERFLSNGVQTDHIFRTDLGDDEGGKEWDEGRIIGHVDKRGDDDIDILIRPNGEIVVEYR